MIQHEFGNDAQPPLVGRLQEFLEVAHGAVHGVDAVIVRRVITVIPQRGGIKRQQPDGRDAQAFQIIEFGREPLEIADAVAVAVGERPNVNFINDGVLIPDRIVVHGVVVRGQPVFLRRNSQNPFPV
jgi:hypothetical protein